MTVEKLENLLLNISDKENNEEEAIKAFGEIYREYSRYVYSILLGALSSMGMNEKNIIDVVLNNTFYIVYEKTLLLSFSFPQNANNDNCFKAWLAVIAKNELKRVLKDYYNKTKPLGLVSNEAPIESEDIDDEIFESTNLKMMNDALNTLSDRDKEILRTIYLYYEEGKNTPSEVLDLLCEMHQTTKDNIRQIKKRSEKKIIDFFAKHSQLKPLKNGR